MGSCGLGLCDSGSWQDAGVFEHCHEYSHCKNSGNFMTSRKTSRKTTSFLSRFLVHADNFVYTEDGGRIFLRNLRLYL
jgi:hypothetical protein